MDYELMSYKELQTLCKERRLRANGTKLGIIERLASWDVEEGDEKGYDAQSDVGPDDGDGNVTVNIKTLMGSWYRFTCQEDQTIGDVKTMLHDKSGVEPDGMRLSYMNGHSIVQLADERILRDFGYSDIYLDMHIRLMGRRK